MPTSRRAMFKVNGGLLANDQSAPESPAELDLGFWEARSEGLIFFDAAGNFRSCNEKFRKLAGSTDGIAKILAGFSWPCEFAASGQPVGNFRERMDAGASSRQVEVSCVRTRGGFVAAFAFAPHCEPGVSGPAGNDVLPDIFSAHISERREISRHLHSALTQDLVALSLSLSALRDERGLELSEAIAHVEQCCRGVRALSYVLAPPSFLDSGLMETLTWYAGVLRADAGVDFAIEAEPLPEDPPEEIKSVFFAALQHMAAAAIWRPRGAKIRVRLGAREGNVSMQVDSSCQPGEPAPESPLIRARAEALGGRMRLITSPEAATLDISVPWSVPD